MTKLEEEIWTAITNGHLQPYQCRSGGMEPGVLGTEEAAKAAAEVAKRYIEKAISDLAGLVVTDDEFDQWLKNNGVV